MKLKFLLIILLTFALLFYVSLALAGSAIVSWNANTEDDLAGYKIYYGTSTRIGDDPKDCGLCGYKNRLDVGLTNTPSKPSYNFSDLTDGQTYYFSVTAYDTSGNESSFSEEVSKYLVPAAPPVTPSVSLSKSVNKSSAKSGDILKYTIAYQNTSSVTAYNLVITDNIPTGTTYLEGSVSQGGHYDSVNKKIIWTIGNLTAGQSGQVSFEVKID